MVTNNSCERTVSIQVKTGRDSLYKPKKKPEGSYYSWPTSEKVIELRSPSLMYAYVNLNGWPETGKHPEVFFVSSDKVSEVVGKEKSRGSTLSCFWLRRKDAENYLDINSAEKIINYLKAERKHEK